MNLPGSGACIVGVSASPLVLVVDDESAIRELVSTVLSYEGFVVREAASGDEAVRLARQAPVDLVVLDVMLPDFDGFEVQRRLAGAGVHAPVVFLTARDEVEDRIRGLRAGADDYVVKPFSIHELVARVEAVLRRSKGTGVRANVMQVDDLVLDDAAREVRRGSERIELTPTEYRLLSFLMRHRGQAVSKAQIRDHVWDYDFGGDGNIVETYVSYLRRKIDRGRPPLIHTVRGFGYVIRPVDR